MSLYEVNVEHEFPARHAVRLPDGTLEPPHLHNWRVTACFRAERLDEAGLVVDFIQVQEAMRTITADLRGHDLNEVPELAGPGTSAEAVAQLLATRLGRAMGCRVYRLAVTEAPGCTAAYYPDGA